MMIFMSFILNFLFLNFNNPLIMSILLILQTILINLIMGKIYFSFWFSYIMFLVFIGGLFILFIYIISLIFNNLLFMKFNKILMIISIIFLIKILFSDMNSFSFLYLNYDINKLFNMNLKENYLNMIKFFNFPNNLINLFMVMYLFLLMIIVVKITNFLKGPIRSINM